MSCDSNRVDRCLDRDEDWVLTIFCQNADAPGGIGTARDLSGLQAKLWIKTQDGAQVIHGQVGAIGTAVATPPDHRGKATGEGTPVVWVITEATINALSADILATNWDYKARLSDSDDDDEGEVLAWGSIVLLDNARLRP